MIGWALTFVSAVGNATNDIFKKNLLAKGLSGWECIGLINGFGAFLTLGWCLSQDVIPKKIENSIMIGGMLTGFGKILAQYLYYLALARAPLSHVIPYLAWNPVFLLVVGFLFLHENPTIYGICGCLVVLLGAYLISLDAKTKQKNQQKTDSIEYQTVNEPELPVKKDNFLIAFIKSIWSFKAGLFMMGVSFCWTFTAALEKYILYGSGIPAPYFLGIQRAFMGIPCLLYSTSKRPLFIDHTFSSFFPLFLGSFFDSMTVVTYFIALNYVYVSYVIAIKRAGNIFLSVLIGRVVYKETLTPMTLASALCMIVGVLCIVLGQKKRGKKMLQKNKKKRYERIDYHRKKDQQQRTLQMPKLRNNNTLQYGLIFLVCIDAVSYLVKINRLLILFFLLFFVVFIQISHSHSLYFSVSLTHSLSNFLTLTNTHTYFCTPHYHYHSHSDSLLYSLYF